MRRERLRQHGDRAVRQVDAHAAPLRLDVDGRALTHVVRDVGHGDPQPRAPAGQLLDGDGVVEVARRLGIDRRELDVAEIGSVGALGGPHLARQHLGEVRDGRRELLGDVGAGQDLLDLGARVVRVAEDLEHLGLERPVGDVRVALDLGDDGLAHEPNRDVAHEGHGARDARIVRLQDRVLAGAHELARDLGAPARDDARDAALDAAHAGPGLDLDGVGVHGGAAVARGDVDVLGLVVWHDEAVPGGMNLDSARQLARGRAGRDAIALVEVLE